MKFEKIGRTFFLLGAGKKCSRRKFSNTLATICRTMEAKKNIHVDLVNEIFRETL